MKHAFFNPEAPIPAMDEARLHVVFLCVVRSIVEKHGGTMVTDPETYSARISIPTSKKEPCLDELEALFFRRPSIDFDVQEGCGGVI